MSNLKDLVLDQFEKNLHPELIEFGEKINNLDADIIVLMARKAVGLMDVIRVLGVSSSKREIVCDRVLDLDINYFKGKKVALVDDTLIVGSTIRKAKHKLQENGIEVEVHVFCVDIDNWQPQLITPNSIQVKMSSAKVMSFCIAEVRAFSIISRPYLIDFPLTKEFIIQEDAIGRIFELKEWDAFESPSQTNDLIDNKLLTLYPNELLLTNYYKKVGFGCNCILDNSKLRFFIRNDGEKLLCKVLPIVTLKAISEETVDKLFNAILSNSNCFDRDKKILIQNLNSPTSKLRFIQYSLSYLFGKISIEYFNDKEIFPEGIKLNKLETTFHFGKEISIAVYNLLQNYSSEDSVLLEGIVSVEIPGDILDWCEPVIDGSIPYKQRRNNVVLEFFDLFNKLFMFYELPARVRIKEWVKKDELNKIDEERRLDKGIPFTVITKYFSDKYFLEVKDNLVRVLSIALDISNDFGISVPITCSVNKVVFRAYRHGELGARYNNDLFVKFLFTFLQTNQRVTFPHLLLEKLLVLFYRIGDHENMIDKQEDLLKIGWELMGAVMTRGTRSFFPIRNEDWLTDDLLKNKVIKKVNGEYILTDISKWEFSDTYVKSTHKYRAEELGEMFGNLYKNEEIPVLKESPLDEAKITLLASCTEIKDTSMAIAAELRVFTEWYKDRIARESNIFLNENILSDENSIINELTRLFDKKGYHAFHQAYFKYFNAYKLNDIPNIILKVERFGEENGLIPFTRKWKEVWENLLPNISNKIPQLSILLHQNQKFEGKLNEAILTLWEAGNWITFYEILINQKLLRDYPKVKLDSIVKYYENNFGREFTKTIVEKYLKDNNLKENEIGFITGLANSLKEKRIGSIISDNKTKKPILKIMNIDNRNVVKHSQEKLERFNVHFVQMGFKKESFVDKIENYLRLINDFDKPIDYKSYFDIIRFNVDSLIENMSKIQNEIETIYSNYGVTDFDKRIKDFINTR